MDDSGEFERLLAEIRSIRESKIIHEKGLEAFVGFTTESDFLDLKADARAWSSLFEQHFLHSDIGDDLLFYVKIGGGVRVSLTVQTHTSSWSTASTAKCLHTLRWVKSPLTARRPS